MTSLITILISLLGYGSPADFSDMSERQIQTQIEYAQAEDGIFDEWD